MFLFAELLFKSVYIKASYCEFSFCQSFKRPLWIKCRTCILVLRDSENCFVCRSGPEREAPSDDLILRQLIPEINPEDNETRIQDANTTLSRLCASFTSKISLLLSNCKAGYLRCTFAIHVGRYRTIDGYISLEETSPDFPTARLTQHREFQEVFLQCIQRMLKNWSGLPLNPREFGENSITYFPLIK